MHTLLDMPATLNPNYPAGHSPLTVSDVAVEASPVAWNDLTADEQDAIIDGFRDAYAADHILTLIEADLHTTERNRVGSAAEANHIFQRQLREWVAKKLAEMGRQRAN